MRKTVALFVGAVVCMSGGTAYADLNEDFEAYWNCDEGVGTALGDLSPNNYHGVLRDGATWTDGICGSALSLDGVDDFVELPDIDLAPNPFTICAWVNIQDNTLAGNHWILGRTHGNVPGEYNFAFREYPLTSEGHTYAFYFNAVRETGTFWKATETKFTNHSSPQGWHFYCASWDAANRCENTGEGVDLYIDAELQTDVTGHTSCMLYPRTGTHLTAIGVYEGREPPTPALRSHFAIDPIDEVRIFGRVLTGDEITALYEEGLACLDADGDGIPDGEDACPDSDLIPTVVIDGCDSGVKNDLLDDGCTISDLIADCAAGATNHGEFVNCVAQLTDDLKADWIITGSDRGQIQSCAALAEIP